MLPGGMSRVVPATDRAVAEAALLLRRGGLVAFPTETVYGLGAWARDEDAVRKVFAAKGRPADHPLIVHLASGDAMAAWARRVPAAAARLAEAFWPGPLTLVLERAEGVSDVVTGGQSTVALRVPRHPTALALLRAFGDGVAAPSANRFGHVSPTTALHVVAEFPQLDVLVLDGGACDVGLESTIVDLSAAHPRVLRPGGVPVSRIAAALGQAVEVVERVAAEQVPEATAAATGSPAPRVPGSLERHYAPRTAAWLVAPEALPQAAAVRLGCAVLSRRPAPLGFHGTWRTLPEDPDGYARGLYAALRDLDQAGHAGILIERVPDDDRWLAVRDRLRRATAASREPEPTGSGGRTT